MAVKLTVNLPSQTAAGLKELADSRGVTVTEALRQLIESQRFLDRQIQSGKNVLIQNPADSSTERVIFNIPLQSFEDRK